MDAAASSVTLRSDVKAICSLLHASCSARSQASVEKQLRALVTTYRVICRYNEQRSAQRDWFSFSMSEQKAVFSAKLKQAHLFAVVSHYTFQNIGEVLEQMSSGTPTTPEHPQRELEEGEVEEENEHAERDVAQTPEDKESTDDDGSERNSFAPEQADSSTTAAAAALSVSVTAGIQPVDSSSRAQAETPPSAESKKRRIDADLRGVMAIFTRQLRHLTDLLGQVREECMMEQIEHEKFLALLETDRQQREHEREE